ncbi:MAG: hypothetical protein AVDCRST_MAG73-997, partial [uncultured Thermomicrobiales bacterium]
GTSSTGTHCRSRRSTGNRPGQRTRRRHGRRLVRPGKM